MASRMTKAEKEQITFYSYWLPALGPGKYSVSVTPTLTADVPAEKDSSLETAPVTETFHVGGPRFALTGSEAYSCYPGPDQIGKFYDTLPHIVFDRCTLPWERTIDGTDPTVPHDPWLALILLTDSDFRTEPKPEDRRVPMIATMTLKDLRDLPSAGNVIGPKLTLARYELASDICQTVDLPAAVFRDVMPRKQDLQYLAHVREVETNNKETWSLLKEGKFSVVICNRFPETQAKASEEKDWGIVNTVCLVSLEGWADYLNNPGTWDAGKTYRLVVLGSWRFTSQGSSDFKSRMKDLDDACLLGQVTLDDKGTSPALSRVKEAFDMGFAAVNHSLRNGDTTISWYRGPLVPMWYAESMSYKDISCADAALRYDSTTGMLDASYASAWQLGRLLALQDQAFAQALYRFRTDYQRWIRHTNTQALSEILEKQAAGLTKEAGEALKKKGAALQKDLDLSSSIRELYVDQLKNGGWLAATAPPRLEPGATESGPDIPATVQNWLGQAMLLYGVPFQYLVPDEKMLPAESIRFFYLNPEWLECLLQGACSVGRTSHTDELADQLLRARFFKVSEQLAFKLRSSAKQAADRRRDGTEVNATAPEGQPETKLHWPLSGYLLRSAAVESWIGIEAKAKGKESTGNSIEALQILRIDRLAPDILLCIYNGKVTEIEIKQPPEAIHFGAATTAGGQGGHTKTSLRNIRDVESMGNIDEGVTIKVPTRGQRVVAVSELAATINDELVRENLMESDKRFTSAEFAVEMIESPAKVTFTTNESAHL
jgi:hypothetical protein